MLAGEPFSDHPQSVSPVIGALLRSYNDSVGDTARQELYAYASGVVGSRAPNRVEQARAERLITWTIELQRTRSSRWLLRCRLWTGDSVQQADVFAAVGVHSLSRMRGRDQTEVLTLVDELLSIGPETATPARYRTSSDRDEETGPRRLEALRRN